MQVNLDELFRTAMAQHQAGRLAEAERGYRQILAAAPQFGPGWQMLGIAAFQQQRFEEAVEVLRKAIERGMGADAQINLGEALRALNRHEEAIAAYRAGIELSPNNATAHANLGAALNELGRFAEALPAFERALNLRPDYPNAMYNCGIAVEQLGGRADAIAIWERALLVAPDHPLILNALGAALRRSDRAERAVATLRRLVERNPNFADGCANLARALASIGQFDEALKHADRAVELEPQSAGHHVARAMVFVEAGQLEEAAAAAERAVELNPKDAEAWGTLGGIEMDRDRPVEAAAAYERAAALRPDIAKYASQLGGCYFLARRPDKALVAIDRAVPQHPKLRFDRSILLLSLGRYAEGFDEYEWRWRLDVMKPREFSQPMWDGSEARGRSIFVHIEQGYGDVILFVRYLPMLLATGAKVIVQVDADIREMIATNFPEARVIATGALLPPYDLHVPLLSLPRIFKTTLESIPAEVPYLRATDARIAKWKPIIAAGKSLKAGLVWGGKKIPDPRRSIPLKALAPLGDVPGVSWFSLQTGEPREQLGDPPPGLNLIDIGKDLKDFADTTAVMSLLDVLITIDTAAANLGGAVAARTWTMLPYASDWRWTMDSATTPWFPTVRLFRQQTIGDWAPVVEHVRRELVELARQTGEVTNAG